MNRILTDIHASRESTRPDASRLDAFFIGRAIELAGLGAGRTLTNPMVGAVVCRDGQVVGEGFHEAYGLDHAETVALERAGERARGATMYVTLEPCTHHGKTPPCIDRIIDSGLKRVVVATLDPDPRMDGKGVAALRSSGIQVDVGARAEEALLSNLHYYKQRLDLGCAVTLKAATTWDGRIASKSGVRDTISGPDSRVCVHRLRAGHDAVLVGIETLLIDQPQLDCRDLDDVPVPIPIVLDTDFRFPVDYPWVDQGRRFLIVTGPDPSPEKRSEIETKGGRVIPCRVDNGRVDPSAAITALGRAGVSSVLVEGGARVLSAFLDAGLWDGLTLFLSPALFGPEGVGLADHRIDLTGASLAGVSTVGSDVRVSYVNQNRCAAMLRRLGRRR
jgi:diaminohydroxyphosphoribosylaminopyrimidine deaminase/5-amino-6-(5-phosphoribosylamino)uracil reductase